MPNRVTAKTVATAYGYQTDNKGEFIDLYRYEPKAKDATIKVATIAKDGEIFAFDNAGFPYNRADHECAMAIRATMAIR